MGKRKRWPRLQWHQVAERLMRQTFQIQRRESCGTAFIVSQGTQAGSPSRYYALATAWHVISDMLHDDDFVLFRVIDGLAIHGPTEYIATARLGDVSFDLGLLFLRTGADVLPAEQMMPVRGLDNYPSLGEDLCWFGHPASLEDEALLCRGSLAAYKRKPISYLIDGVAYPGMSGGAVADQRGHVVGLVSKWWEDPNLPRARGMLQAAPSAMVRHVLEDRMGARILEESPEDPG